MTYNFSYIYPEMDSITRKEAAVNRFLDKELSYQSFENAFVLPSKDLWKDGKCFGGVVTKDGDFVESSAWHEGKRCDKYSFEEKAAITREETVIYMGFYNPCWGHAITDNLKKLWFLKTAEYQELRKNGAKLICLTIDNQPMPSYIHRLFQLADVDLSSFELITGLSRFKRVIIPDNSFIADNGQRYFTNQYRETISTIKRNAQVGETQYPKKLYFTRTQLKSNRDIGEKSIEKVFKKKGYTIVAPEQHCVDDQIQMLMHCNSFAATEGSISHNAVFCNFGTEVVIIRKCNDVNKYQMAVNEVADVNVTYIDAHHSSKAPKNAPWVGPFYMYINSKVEEYFGGRIIHFPRELSLSWWLYHYNNSALLKKMKRLSNRILN